MENRFETVDGLEDRCAGDDVVTVSRTDTGMVGTDIITIVFTNDCAEVWALVGMGKYKRIYNY